MTREANAPWRDEELLREKYYGEGMTGPEIAEEWGCSARTISTWREKHGIETKPQNYGEAWADEERLRKLYVEDRMTTYEIAEKFDVNDTTISRALDRNGIQSRSGGSGLEPNQPWHDEDTLRELYVEEKLTAEEIGERLGCSQATVLLNMRECGIPRRHNLPHFKTREDGYEVIRHKIGDTTHIVRVHRLVAVANGELEPSEFCDWDKVVHHKKPIPWLNTHGNLEAMDRGEHQTMHMLEYHSE